MFLTELCLCMHTDVCTEAFFDWEKTKNNMQSFYRFPHFYFFISSVFLALFLLSVRPSLGLFTSSSNSSLNLNFRLSLSLSPSNFYIDLYFQWNIGAITHHLSNTKLYFSNQITIRVQTPKIYCNWMKKELSWAEIFGEKHFNDHIIDQAGTLSC